MRQGGDPAHPTVASGHTSRAEDRDDAVPKNQHRARNRPRPRHRRPRVRICVGPRAWRPATYGTSLRSTPGGLRSARPQGPGRELDRSTRRATGTTTHWSRSPVTAAPPIESFTCGGSEGHERVRCGAFRRRRGADSTSSRCFSKVAQPRHRHDRSFWRASRGNGIGEVAAIESASAPRLFSRGRGDPHTL